MPGPERRTPAETLAGNHMVTSDRFVPRAQKEQDKEQDDFCAMLGGLNKKKDDSGGPPEMLGNGAVFLLGPTRSIRHDQRLPKMQSRSLVRRIH